MRFRLPRNQEVRQRYDEQLARMDDMTDEEMSHLLMNTSILAQLGMTIDQAEKGIFPHFTYERPSSPVFATI